MARSNRLLRLAVAGGLAALVPLAVSAPAGAQPATTASYPAWSTATRYTGLAFDTCTAPPLSSVQAWGTSPYRAIGVGCSSPEGTADLDLCLIFG